MTAGELSTSLELLDHGARFEVTTANPVYRQQLVQAGFQRASGDLFVRYVDNPSGVREIHENFARHIEEILLQHAGIKPVPWGSALREFLRRVHGVELKWWLSGSAALAVRGIDVTPRDLDFAVTDSHALGRLLQDALVEPVTRMREWVAEWFGRAFLGALVEWVSDVRSPIVNDHGLEQGAEAASRLERVPWEGHVIPVTPLDLQLVVAERRGQRDRAEKIRRLLPER
jgi:hypothetical protein